MERAQAEGLVRALRAAELPELEKLDASLGPDFHSSLRQKEVLGFYRVSHGRDPIYLVVTAWNRNRPELYHLVIFARTGDPPLLGMHQAQDGKLRWRFSASRQRGGAEQRQRFVAIFGAAEAELPLPSDPGGVVLFLDELQRVINAKLSADAVPERIESNAAVAGWLWVAPGVLSGTEATLQLEVGASRPRPGSPALIYRPGAGLVAHGVVVAEPRPAEAGSRESWQAPLRIEQLLEQPVSGSQLRRHPDLVELWEHLRDETCWPLQEAELRALRQLSEGRPPPRVLKIAPGGDGGPWQEGLSGGFICVGWDEVGDLRGYPTRQALEEAFSERFVIRGREAMARKAAELWMLRELRPGDRVIANQGPREVLALGVVQAPGYRWDAERPSCRHTVRVAWDSSAAGTIPTQRPWGSSTISEVPVELYHAIRGGWTGWQPGGELAALVDLRAALQEQGLHGSEELLSTYLLALQVSQLVILTGVEGLGKRRLAVAIARWFAGSEADQRLRRLGRGTEGGQLTLLGTSAGPGGQYQRGELLPFLLEARAEADQAVAGDRPPRPYFLLLDGADLLRLAPQLERLLAAADPAWPLSLHDDAELAEGGLPGRLVIPSNLHIVAVASSGKAAAGLAGSGLVERGCTLELSLLDLPGFAVTGLAGERGAVVHLRLPGFAGQLERQGGGSVDDWQQLGLLQGGELRRGVVDLQQILEQHGQRPLGMEAISELARFMVLAGAQAEEGEPGLRAAFDLAVLIKLLPRLAGSREQLLPLLRSLFAYALRGDLEEALAATDPFAGWTVAASALVSRGAGETALLPRCAARLLRLARQLKQHGSTSFFD